MERVNPVDDHSAPPIDINRAFELYCAELYRHARRLMNNPADAEEIVQEAFLKAVEFKPRPDNFRAWLHTVVENLCINRRRRETRSQKVSRNPRRHIDWDFYNHHGEAEAPPDNMIIRIMMGVSLEYQNVLFLVDMQGHSYKEAAASLDVPIGTIMSRLHRARTAVRKKLERAA